MTISWEDMVIELVAGFAVLAILIAGLMIYAYNMRTKWDFSREQFAWRFPVEDIVPASFPSTFNVLLDQHVHTVFRGGNLSLRQAIQWHLANGYNAMFVTEHNGIQDPDEVNRIAKEFEGKILVMQGMEWTTDRIHLNFFGIRTWEEPVPTNPTDEEISHAIQIVHEQGGIVVVNHPRSQRQKAPDHPSFQAMLDLGVDYVEVVAGDYFDAEASQWCAPATPGGFGRITGNDIHFPIPANGWTTLQVPELTEDAIMDELRARQTDVIYYAAGTPDFADRRIPEDRKKMAFFIALGKVFGTTNRSQLEINWRSVCIAALLYLAAFGIVQCVSWIVSLL